MATHQAAAPLTARALGKARRTLLPGYGFRPMPFGVFRGIIAGRSLSAPFWTWSGFYEFEIQRYFKRFAPPGGHVYDVGGGDGLLALMFARLTGGMCVTFEGDERQLEIIREHVARNGPLGEKVDVVEGWVGGEGLSLDAFAESHRAPTLLKIDVEGAEYAVLQSARVLLSGAGPHVIVEVHGRDQEALCAELLTGLGYEVAIVPLRRRLREEWGRDGSNFDINHWLIAEGSAPVRESVAPRRRVRHR